MPNPRRSDPAGLPVSGTGGGLGTPPRGGARVWRPPPPPLRGPREGRSVTWVLDPIDGTVNFVYAIPAYAVSVAAQVDGVSVAGAVADVTAARVYSAGLGMGAHVIDAAGRREALHCNTIDDLSMALVGTRFRCSPRRPAAHAP